MKTIFTILFPLTLCLTLILSACKPTENNYRQAYEAAQAKKKKADNDADFDISRMIRDDLPRREKIDGDSAYIRREHLMIYGDDASRSLPRCNVAVAAFRMRSNAEAMAQRLRSEEKLDAFIIRDRNELLYVIANSAPTLPEAIKKMREFISAHPNFVYVGLPQEPVIEIAIR